MDAIALLCSLHGDGPSTLRRLRQVDCHALEDLQGLGVERLTGLLEIAPAAARRFLREARHLAQRIGESPLEQEAEDTPLAPALLAPALGEVRPLTAEPAPARVERDSAPLRRSPREGLETGSRGLVDRVLAEWRQKDAESAAEFVENPFPVLSSAGPAQRSFGASSGALRQSVEPKAVGVALVPGVVVGLDRQTCDLLRLEGVGSLRELADLSDEQLIALSSTAPYTKLKRWQFLAVRQLEATAGAVPLVPLPRTAANLEPIAAQPVPEPVVHLEPAVHPRPVVHLDEKFSPSARPEVARTLPRLVWSPEPPLAVPSSEVASAELASGAAPGSPGAASPAEDRAGGPFA